MKDRPWFAMPGESAADAQLRAHEYLGELIDQLTLTALLQPGQSAPDPGHVWPEDMPEPADMRPTMLTTLGNNVEGLWGGGDGND